MTVVPASSPSLSAVLALEEIGPQRFRGAARPGPATRTYGGEVAGLAVLAAGRTVEPARQIHSAHMHFLLPGDTSFPVELTVKEVRDGGSFSARRVEAHQHGRVIFSMTASFQVVERGLEHQLPVLTTPGPEETPSYEQMFADDPENLQWAAWLTGQVDFEARFIGLPARAAAARGQRIDPRQQVWMRSKRPVGESEVERSAALAYVSDILLLSTALGPHELTLQDGRLQFATISHTVWFHAPLSVDEWFLYDQESRWAGGGRALCRGEIFDSTGQLCATLMQEGLLRVRS